MTGIQQDPTAAIRLKASQYPNVDKGTACTQSSFKTGKRAFLFVGMQGGRHKVMLKLQKSLPEATKLAKKEPDNYQVGSTGWVTARFTDDCPMPQRLWKKWLDESYELFAVTALKKKAAKKKSPKKASAKKTSVKKKAAKKKTVRKKSAG